MWVRYAHNNHSICIQQLSFAFLGGNGQRGVYPPVFLSNGGIGQTRPREAPARASDCLKFSSDALARCRRPCRALTPFLLLLLFSSTSLVLTGPRRTRVLRIPPFDHMLGGYAPANLLNLCVTPRDYQFPQLDRSHTPKWPLMAAQKKQVRTHVCTCRHRTTARTVQGPNNRQLRVVAIDFFEK